MCILIQTARVKFVYMQFLLERGKKFERDMPN